MRCGSWLLFTLAIVHLGDDMVTQDEVIILLSKLHRSDILHANIPPDIAELHFRASTEKRNKVIASLMSPMMVRIPLYDPEKLLVFLQPVGRLCFSYLGGIVWVLTLLVALVLSGIHWQGLANNLSDQLLSTSNLILLLLVYPFVKILHEFGHGLAVKRWQGEVHETGIMFLVFMPIPYVEASASIIFRPKWQRITVSAAGIMVELFLAALAMITWVYVEPGIVRAIAFNVMVIAGVSTLFFNGNPLLRFDGYYILADLLEIPNLGTRSNHYLAYLARRHLLGIKKIHSPATSSGEAFWLFTYGHTAFIYRIFISITIAIFVAGKFFVVGILLALWSLFNVLIMPTYKLLKYLFTSHEVVKKKMRIVLLATLAGSVMMAVLFVMPVPYFTVVQGVVQVPEHGVVRAGGEGFIVEVNAQPGQWVEKGDLLLTSVNKELESNIKKIDARLSEYHARFQQSKVTDKIEAEILRDEIIRIQGERDWFTSRWEGLLIKSGSTGFFHLDQLFNMEGRFVRQGTLLGYVINPEKMIVNGVISQDDVVMIRNNSNDIIVRLASNINDERPAQLIRHVPAATRDLPSLTLSVDGGGLILLDPTAGRQAQAFYSIFKFELLLPDTMLPHLDERVYIRFAHDPEPVVYRWYRSVRRLFLSRFAT